MIFDLQNMFGTNQSIIQAVGTLLSTNAIDLGAGGIPIIGTANAGAGTAMVPDPGRGGMVEVFAQITTAVAAAGGAAEGKVQLITSAAANLGTPTVIASSEAIAKALLIPGYQFRIRGIPGGVVQRYLGMQLVVSTNDFTAGVITWGLLANRQSAQFPTI